MWKLRPGGPGHLLERATSLGGSSQRVGVHSPSATGLLTPDEFKSRRAGRSLPRCPGHHLLVRNTAWRRQRGPRLTLLHTWKQTRFAGGGGRIRVPFIDCIWSGGHWLQNEPRLSRDSRLHSTSQGIQARPKPWSGHLVTGSQPDCAPEPRGLSYSVGGERSEVSLQVAGGGSTPHSSGLYPMPGER